MRLEEGKKYTANCVISFKKLKGVVKTETGKRMLTAGQWFIPLQKNIQFTWFGISQLKIAEVQNT